MYRAAVDVTLTPAAEHTAVLGRLFQLYFYDFSEMMGLDVGDDGLFTGRRPEGYWTASRYHPFLVHAGGRLAGFAIVDTQRRLTGELLWDMNQFFILRRHRLGGVGARAAAALFDAFPGHWEVREVASNVGAQAFWRKVIGRHTGGRFEEVVLDDETWKGPVQSFEAGKGARGLGCGAGEVCGAGGASIVDRPATT
jgi:predicted acetyltransferase